MIVIIKRKSMFYASLFLTNPYLFLTNPDLWNYIFRFIWNVYTCISIYWALIVIIYSHLLLSFLLINLDNVRRCFSIFIIYSLIWFLFNLDNVRSPLFWLFLYFAYIFSFFWEFFSSYKPRVSFYTF